MQADAKAGRCGWCHGHGCARCEDARLTPAEREQKDREWQEQLADLLADLSGTPKIDPTDFAAMAAGLDFGPPPAVEEAGGGSR
jgi:hypothetical protein